MTGADVPALRVRAAGLLLLLLLAGPAAAVFVEDPAGDGQLQDAPPPRDPGATDIVGVEGELVDGSLHLRMELAGGPPVAGDAEEQRRYTYLFLVARGGGDAPLHGQVTIAATCHFHRGMEDLSCQVTQGNATVRRIGQVDRNVTLRLAIDWSEGFRVGGAAHESLPNGTQRDILVQDFTANAFPSSDLPTGPGSTAPGQTPWWKTPWILLVALLVLVATGWAWSHRPGAATEKKRRR